MQLRLEQHAGFPRSPLAKNSRLAEGSPSLIRCISTLEWRKVSHCRSGGEKSRILCMQPESIPDYVVLPQASSKQYLKCLCIGASLIGGGICIRTIVDYGHAVMWGIVCNSDSYDYAATYLKSAFLSGVIALGIAVWAVNAK